jgi:hypothetical protein
MHALWRALEEGRADGGGPAPHPASPRSGAPVRAPRQDADAGPTAGRA